METKIVAEFKNEEDQTAGVVATFENLNGERVYSAALKDLDSGNYVIGAHIFSGVDAQVKAIAYAKKIANV